MSIAEKRMDIIRVVENAHGTFGVLIDYDQYGEPEPFAVTLERRWKGNLEDVSCIPAGEYVCRRVESPKFGETFQVMNVPNRAEILFHSGNKEKDSKGCIIVAEEYGVLDLITAILNSKRGFKEFMERLTGWFEFKLVIHRALVKAGYSRLK